MYMKRCLGHIGVSYAKAIYFWRLAAADPRFCIAEDATPQVLSLHRLLPTLSRSTVISSVMILPVLILILVLSIVTNLHFRRRQLQRFLDSPR